MKLYIDGIYDKQMEVSGNMSGDGDYVIGMRHLGQVTADPGGYFDGVIDEVRITQGARSDAWIKATYYTAWDDLLTFEESSVVTDNFTTLYTYDSANRLVSVIYPTGENVTQSYNYRGLPHSLSSSINGTLVSGMEYNQLGSVTQIDFGNGLSTNYRYWGIDYGTESYGKLYSIEVDGLMNVTHSWDETGNLEERTDQLTSETEEFQYDALDRLTSASLSGQYGITYTYDEIGNILTKGGLNYSYESSRPHAVTAVDTANYTYDDNGNMLTRKGDYQSIVWDAENRPVSITTNGTVTTFVYDGDGNRVRKTVGGGEDILYINTYYEENLTTGNATLSYYLSGTLIAQKEGTELRYMHQDHLRGTSLMTSWNGTSLGIMKYFPYGSTRSGNVPTDIQFTGQRYDDTGLYYYNARYYDPEIGRFISPDTIIPNPSDPQSFNRYAYCLNNPLKYIDPTGRFSEDQLNHMGITPRNTSWATYQLLREAKVGDQLVIDQGDGSSELYTFVESSEYDFYSPYSDVSLQSNDNQYSNVYDIFNNEDNDILTLYEKRPTLVQDSNYNFSVNDDYFYIDMIVSPPNCVSTPLESHPYAHQPLAEVSGKEMFYRAADTVEFVSPVAGSIPEEYLLFGLFLAGVTGWPAAVAVVGFYLIFEYGADVLRLVGDDCDH